MVKNEVYKVRRQQSRMYKYINNTKRVPNLNRNILKGESKIFIKNGRLCMTKGNRIDKIERKQMVNVPYRKSRIIKI